MSVFSKSEITSTMDYLATLQEKHPGCEFVLIVLDASATPTDVDIFATVPSEDACGIMSSVVGCLDGGSKAVLQ